MSINNNVWELAEAYLAGSMPAAEVNALQQRLQTDSEFALEFNDAVNVVRSMEGNGKQKRFRAMLRDIHHQQATATGPKKGFKIAFPPHFWRTAAVAAGVAILTSTITIWSLNPSLKKHESQYTTISREVGAIKKVQAQQQAEQRQLKEIIIKGNKQAPPPSDVKYSGTGFALNNEGYFVTADHVIHPNGDADIDSVYIQTREGQYYKAALLYYNHTTDVAILKVEKKNFRFGKGEVPYALAGEKAGLGARIFTLGYPKDDIKYGEGYISAKNGFDGDVMQYTLELPAGHGQSGSPVVDGKGNVLGLLTAVSGEEEANTYAVSAKAVIDMVHKLPDNTLHLPKKSHMTHMTREEQITKMEAYTFSVKVYKK